MNSAGLFPSATGRRAFLKGAGMTGIGLVGAATLATSQPAEAYAVNDADILNFALNLEYLEAEYYSVALTGKTLIQNGVLTSADETGPTTGGSMIPDLSSNKTASTIAVALRNNEVDHVLLLRSALSSGAVKKPAINLDALGYGFASVNEFYKLGRQLEEVGTSAYLGAAPSIVSDSYLATAGSILAVEAKHTGAFRMLCIQNNVSSPAVDSIDVPPATSAVFDALSNGLTPTRTPQQVLKIVYGGGTTSGGFFPSGLNGTIK